MLGGRFDEHPWGVADGTVVVDDPTFPAMRHLPRLKVFHDELYQIKDFSRNKSRFGPWMNGSALRNGVLIHSSSTRRNVISAPESGLGTKDQARSTKDNTGIT